MAFLEILTEFTGKLLKQDKKVVLGYLDKRIAGGVPNSRGEVCVKLFFTSSRSLSLSL